MNLLEEAKKLLDRGKPLVEGALEDFLKRHVKDFLFSGEFEIRRGLGVDEEMGSREYRKVMLDAYESYTKPEEPKGEEHGNGRAGEGS